MDAFASDRRRLIGAGAILAGVGTVAATSRQAQGATEHGLTWQPTFETLDFWLDKPGTRHRMMFDTLSADGAMEALGYANNLLHVSETDYALKPEQTAVVVIFRHMSTPFGFNNAMWAKFGATFADKLGLKGKQAIQATTVNPALTGSPQEEQPPNGMDWAADGTIAKLAAKGVRFAVCGLATAGLAHMLAGKGNPKALEAELRSNLAPGALMVPAGIVAVNRAQEHGYTFAYTG